MNIKVCFMLLALIFGAQDVYSAQEPTTVLGEELFLCIDRNDRENAKRLIAAGADVNFRGLFQMTPLMLTTRLCDVELVKMLVRRGADARAVSDNGYTALHYIAQKKLPADNCKVIIDCLLFAGAGIDAKINTGETALHFAALRDCLDIARHLLNRGANPFIRNSTGQLPADLVCPSNFPLLWLLRGAVNQRF